jgi:hypothetical protein
MIKGLAPKKELLLACTPDVNGDMSISHALVGGRRVHAAGEGIARNFSGPLRVALFSLESYFERADLAAASVKLLPLVARRHVDSELVFDDALYRLRARSVTKGERTITADIAALPERDMEEAVSQLPLQQQPCLQLVPMELAIAALVERVTREPVMVFWQKAGFLVSMLVHGGMVLARMRERVNEQERDAIIARAESGLRAAAVQAGENRETYQVLYTGELAALEGESSERATHALAKKLTKLFRTGKHAPRDSVLRTPELYGLPFVPAEWSFLDMDYQAQVNAWRYARPAAAVAAAAGVAAAVYGGILHAQALWLASDFDQRRVELGAAITEFEQMRPSDEDMAAVDGRLRVQHESYDEVRLDRMLNWLTHLVPEGVVISSLELEPVPLPRQRTPGLRVSYPPGEKPFQLKMQIVLAETMLDDAEASAADVVRRLSQRLKMVDSRLEVPAPEPGVRRNVVLIVKAHAHAVNFS